MNQFIYSTKLALMRFLPAVCLRFLCPLLGKGFLKRLRHVDLLFVLQKYRRFIEYRICEPVRFTEAKNEKLSTSGYAEIEFPPQLAEKATIEALQFYQSSKGDQKNNKTYLREMFTIKDVRPSSAIFKLATSPDLISLAGSYFKSSPVLYNITLMISPKIQGNVKLAGSQKFHRDGDDSKNLKFWLMLEDVSNEMGPTFVLDKISSEALARKINYRQGQKIEDCLLVDKTQDLFSLVGKKGSGFVVDTSQCFHMGSRNQGAKPRLVLMIHYVTRKSNYFWPQWMGGKDKLGRYPYTQDLDEHMQNLLFTERFADS